MNCETTFATTLGDTMRRAVARSAREQNGVLSTDFRARGTEGLREVDASVFPRLPRFFIVGAVYMIGENAAEVILADAQS
jgi:choline dehydrogenase